MTNVFNHVGVSVKNLDGSIDWYKECFGFKETRRFDKPDLEIMGATLELRGFVLELLQPYNSKSKKMEGILQANIKDLLSETGITHFALTVDDFYDIHKKLSENNEHHTDIVNDKFFFCADYDGNLIEIKKG